MPKMLWNTVTKALAARKEESSEHDPLHIATAALMIQVSVTHDDFSEEEKTSVLACIEEHFDLETQHALSVFEQAQEHHDEAVDLYRFTRPIMAVLEYEQQVEIVRLLYRVAFADNHLEHFEEHIITQISSLLGVGPQDRVRIKQQVRAEVDGEERSNDVSIDT